MEGSSGQKFERAARRFIDQIGARSRQWLSGSGARLLSRGLEVTRQSIERRGIGFYSTLGSVILSSYFVADLVSLGIQSKLPAPSQSGFGSPMRARRNPVIDDYSSIAARNLFNSDGKIPGEEGGDGSMTDPGGVPVKTSLPFNLIGTIILRDELRSIATIEDKSASLVYPVRVEDEIPSKARILKIEPRKVIFLNTGSGRREFVELPEELDASMPKVGLMPSTRTGAAIERQGNSFSVPKLELDRAFADLNQVLTQARAVPHYENGVPAGYKLFQVTPDGFFGKLGLKDQDIICGIDGQPVNDPAKALELLGSLRTANHIDLCIKRENRAQTFSYDIR
jgi:general secretion pathway protein C